MKKNRCLSLVCAGALLVGLLAAPAAAVTAPADRTGVTIVGQGWYETLCAELTGVTDADVEAVAYLDADGEMTQLTGADFEYLVRDMAGGGVRIDIPGVKAGVYALEVTLKNGRSYVLQGLEVKAYDRSGFAHKTHYDHTKLDTTSWTMPEEPIMDYTEGVGAYNDDGTLKDNAIVLYVTDENKETVTLSAGGASLSGIGNILNTAAYKKNNNIKILGKVKDEGRPLVIRFLGTVTAPTGLTTPWTRDDYGGNTKDNGYMAIMKEILNLTIEGIGPNACIDGWGFAFDAGAAGGFRRLNYGRNFEVRNLSFRNTQEDAIGIMGDQSNGSFEAGPAEHIWIHNCSFYKPAYIAGAKEDDKHYGDGTVDFKCGQYMTMSYCYFDQTQKCHLVGSDDTDPQYHVTWHHNYWKGCRSRTPLTRQADVHMYNNLIENQTDSCVSLRANCFVYGEYNMFRNCTKPVYSQNAGGVYKSYHDEFTGCSGTNEAQVVTDDTKDSAITSACKYDNFDLDPDLSYIPSGNYSLQTDLAQAEATVRAEAGVQKRDMSVAGSNAVEYGTLGSAQWFYNADGEVVISGDVPEEDMILVAGYNQQGRCTRIRLVKAGRAMLGEGVELGKIFWLDGDKAPRYAAGGWEKK